MKIKPLQTLKLYKRGCVYRQIVVNPDCESSVNFESHDKIFMPQNSMLSIITDHPIDVIIPTPSRQCTTAIRSRGDTQPFDNQNNVRIGIISIFEKHPFIV